MIQKIQEAGAFLASGMKETPKIGMVTGTGLGSLTERMEIAFRMPYEEIPHFPKSTIMGHRGSLVSGTLGGKALLALEGRFHLYEGYSPTEITFPIRVMSRLGVEHLLISSAAGGLNPRFARGDLMVVTDHINLTGTNPLVGPNLDGFGPRFPDMTAVYDPKRVECVKRRALDAGIPLREGVYAGVLGPSLETPSETRFLRMIGADAVGMSTVSEAIAGVHSGMKVAAVVVITNVNRPDCMEKTSLEDVIAAAEGAGPVLASLWEKVVAGLTL